MGIEILECQSNEDLAKAFAPIHHYFGGLPPAETLSRIEKVFDYRRAIYADEGGVSIGGAAAHEYELTVPGGKVPAAGVTVVGVLPTHRRRGVLRQLMRRQLDQVRSWNESVAFLWASEETIYGRFGYGLASLNGQFEVPKTANAFAHPLSPTGEVRLLDAEHADPLISDIYDRTRNDSPGFFSRTENWWSLRRLFESPDGKSGPKMNRAVLFQDGKPEGYALYRVHSKFEDGENVGHVGVLEAVATNPVATAELWRFLLDLDWVPKVCVDYGPVDHPLLLLLARPSKIKLTVSDGLWVRLVDVQKALQARAFGPGGPVVLEVRDEFCPENQGCYRVGNGVVERTEATADISLDVSALGSAYLGGFTFAELQRGLRLEENTAGAVARADAVFVSDRAPWCPEVF